MRTKSMLFILLAFVIYNTNATTYKVNNISQFNQQVKTLVAGDSIILANGVWKDVELKFKGVGKEGKNICLTAETFGKVTLEGLSRLQLSGSYLEVSGLVFKNGQSPKSTVIEFRTSSTEYAYNSTLTNCVIDGYSKTVKDSSDHWLGVYGKKNTIEYCYFGGKTNAGTTLVVWPNDSNSINNNHLIYRNYFGPRPRLGANGGETIRIGTSHVCKNSSATIVDGNYFEHCNGEIEIISNKSCDNKFLNNTFFESEGCLTLRHGNRATVAGNWFIGNGKANTGGVRIINEGHIIYNNFFYMLRGDEFRSSLAIMNAIPDSPDNGYAAVKNVMVANNTYYDCANPWSFGLGFGERNRTVKPESTLLLNNLVYCPNTAELIKEYDKGDGIKLDNNLLIGSKGLSTIDGTIAGEVKITKVWGIDVPYSTLKAKKLPFVKYDILGLVRGEAVIGALQGKDEAAKLDIATSKNCGPDWYKSEISSQTKPKQSGKSFAVAAGIDNIYQMMKKAKDGDTLTLDAGEHIVTKKLAINKNLVICAANGLNSKPVIKTQFDKASGSVFEISGTATFKIENIAIDGNSSSAFPAKYGFTSSKEDASGYSLFINNCDIYDFNVETGAIYKANKNSLADTIKVTNSTLSNSYRGFSLGEEKDDKGKYNAENIIFENSVFNHFTQYILDYYRGGVDESTLGGSLYINHCVINDVANEEKQSIIKTTGIVKAVVKNSIFSNSIAKTSVKLSGSKNSITNCCISSCSTPKVEAGAKSENIIFANPKFEKKSFIISDTSKLNGKADDGGKIGLK